MKFIVLCILAAAFTSVAVGKEWGMCELAREMHAHGFSKKQLDDWMCLVRHESGYRQTAINPHNSDGSTDWGLFQINDRFWCKNTQKYNQADQNLCGMNCQSFLSGDISNNLRCVKMVYREHGFGGWVAWKKYCQGDLPDTSPCFERGGRFREDF